MEKMDSINLFEIVEAKHRAVRSKEMEEELIIPHVLCEAETLVNQPIRSEEEVEKAIMNQPIRSEEEVEKAIMLEEGSSFSETVPITKGLVHEEEGIISDENGNEKENCIENSKSDSVDSENILNSDIHAENAGKGAEAINSPPSKIIDNSSVNKNGNVLLSIIKPHTLLPQPEPPAGVSFLRSQSMPENSLNMPAIGKFFREKSNSLSSAITKTLLLTKSESSPEVTEFELSGMKVIVKLKSQSQSQVKNLPGRVSFFSRSNCRDCTAVRSFLRKENLNYVEINIDVYPLREKELIERTGSANVPQIFLNEKLLGGLVALNSLRNSGMLEKKLTGMLAGKCPEDAPAAPVYGFDDDDEEKIDKMVDIVRVLRQKLPIQDRIMRMKIVKNCFAGAELVEILIYHLDCGRKKAVEIGKNLARRHFIHHVLGENEFEDGKHFYRFLEHEPFVPKCYNFRGSTNDNEPKDAAILGQRLGKIMSALLESYASDDRHHLDYMGISNSEEFRRYTNLVQDLHRVNILTLSADEKLAFLLNLHNAMAIHAVIRVGHPGGMIDRRAFFSEFQYIVGGFSYSLSGLKDGILRSNRRAPFSLMKPFASGDRRLEMAFQKVNPLIHFGLCNATRSSPAVRFFTPQSIESELRYAAREYFQRDDAMQVDLAKRTVYLNRMIKWYSADFGQEKEILKWTTGYLDATKAGLLTHLMGDGGPVNVVYSSFDWSLNA